MRNSMRPRADRAKLCQRFPQLLANRKAGMAAMRRFFFAFVRGRKTVEGSRSSRTLCTVFCGEVLVVEHLRSHNVSSGTAVGPQVLARARLGAVIASMQQLSFSRVPPLRVLHLLTCTFSENPVESVKYSLWKTKRRYCSSLKKRLTRRVLMSFA